MAGAFYLLAVQFVKAYNRCFTATKRVASLLTVLLFVAA
jgi:hypothetical protein